MTLRLNIIVTSTRPGRIGPAIARWVHEHAVATGGFDARLVDLADFNLPIYDEPKHPRLQDYAHDHTRRWSESVDAADAFVFVTPEYNSGPTPALTNALNYLFKEWEYKPAAFVSYGGISGGMRGVSSVRGLFPVLRMMPIPDGVPLPSVFDQIGDDGVFTPKDVNVRSADRMLSELLRWAEALRPMRA